MTVSLTKDRIGLLANRPGGARPPGARYFATDTHQDFEWNGGAWIEVPPVSFDKIVFKANEFVADAGASLVLNNHYPVWSFASGVTQGISAAMTFPPGWDKFHIGFTYVNLGAGSGDIRWQVQMWNFAINLDLTSESPYIDLTPTPVAAGVQNRVSAGFLALDQLASPAFFGSEFGIRVARVGGGPDTLGNAAGVGIVTMNRADS